MIKYIVPAVIALAAVSTQAATGTAYLILKKYGQDAYIVAQFNGPRAEYNCGWIAKATNNEGWGGTYYCSSYKPYPSQNGFRYD